MGITNVIPLSLLRKADGRGTPDESAQSGISPQASPTGGVVAGPYLTTDEAAEYLGVSVRWLQGRPDIPRVNLGRPGAKRAMVRYRRTDLDSYMASRLKGLAREEGR